jgi:hypothetical protein
MVAASIGMRKLPFFHGLMRFELYPNGARRPTTIFVQRFVIPPDLLYALTIGNCGRRSVPSATAERATFIMILDQIDLTDLDFFVKRDIHEAFRVLRREDPVHWQKSSLVVAFGR